MLYTSSWHSLKKKDRKCAFLDTELNFRLNEFLILDTQGIGPPHFSKLNICYCARHWIRAILDATFQISDNSIGIYIYQCPPCPSSWRDTTLEEDPAQM